MAFLDYDGLKRYTEKFKSWVSGSFVPKTPTSWAEIQREVQLGHGAVLFPVGSQLTLTHSVYGDIAMDVVSHDTVKKYGDENAHTMTLMAHDCIASLQFDAPEAMYYAESGLAAGTYCFKVNNGPDSWADGTYNFTLATEVPAGGQIRIDGATGTPLTSLYIKTYASQYSNDVLETTEKTIASGEAGELLGTLNEDLNQGHRIYVGSNNYKESAIRQFLNSDAEAGSVWTPQTHFDRAPSWAKSTAGFLNGCPEDFLDAIATAVVKCSANNTYECPASMGGTVTKNTAYELTDKIFLASETEVGLNGGDVTDGSALYEFFDGASDADRIKYLNGSAQHWWLRTPYIWRAFSPRYVKTSGSLDAYYAQSSFGLVPACIIA